jgi:uncharacterized protein (DUF2236 family)
VNYYKDRPYAEPTDAEAMQFLEEEWRWHGMLGADNEAPTRSGFEFIKRMRDLCGRMCAAWLVDRHVDCHKGP